MENNPDKPNWTAMSRQIFEHGIRNTHIKSEAPIPQPLPIDNSTCGIEPWMLDMKKMEKAPDISEREYASCIVTPGGDDIDMHIAYQMRSLDTMMVPALEGAVMRPDMGYGGIRKNEAAIIMARTPGKTNFLKNLYYGIGIETELIVSEDTTTKPPKGRSQKQHNAIQQMNKRKR